VKRRLAIAMLPATLGIGLLQAVPARATTAPQPKVAVNTTNVVCTGNDSIGRGVCVPWTF
jgi:hypothetical protein